METPSLILIVDDDPIGQKSLEGPLSGQGYQLEFANDGKEALQMASLLTPDLILLDILMPEMDGYEVCHRLRADERLAEIPILMITALDDQDSRLQGIEAGADDFISKPFNRLELRAKVRTITRLNRYRRLQMERSRLEWVVEHADEGYLIINHQHEILYANPQARLFLGIDADIDSASDNNFLSLVQRQYHCEPQENWKVWESQKSIEEGRDLFLVQPQTKTSPSVWLKVIMLDQPIGADTQILMQLRDVTNQMQSQRDMSTFHQMLNHKLRTPLNALQAMIDILANENIELSRAESLEIAQLANNNILQLINDMLDILDFLETPEQAEQGDDFKINQLEILVEQVKNALALENVAINIDKNILQKTITLSQKALESILIELLENAKKFHPKNSPNVEIHVSSTNNMINLKVIDNGISLTPEQLRKVWTPYYQSEIVSSGAMTGMGLGLALVSTLVWQKGGTCRIINREPAPGVIIILELPQTQ